ncbi:glycan biosynthesis hexose transferase WsfD [Amycolatopsis sp. NPDC003865]
MKLDVPKARLGAEARLGIGVFGASLLLFVVRFLVPRPIAMSNNGDGGRVLCGAGITWKGLPEPFVHLAYTVAPGAPPCRPTYLLTQSWLAEASVGLARLAGFPATLSLVVLGLLSSTIAAAAITAIVLGLPYPRRVRLAVAAGLLLVVADSAFFGYFAAILGEGAAFLGLLLIAGGLLLTAREGRWSYAGMAVTFAGGVLAVNAKVQTLIILPILALAVLLVRPGALRGAKRWAAAALVIGGLGAVTLFAQQSVEPALAPDGTYSAFPGDDSREINMFNSIFLNIVDGRHDTQADLAALGLPPSFAQYAGNGWWHPHPATMDPRYPSYRDKMTRENVLGYFASHPGRTLEVLDRAATDQLTARPGYLGSFDQEAGFAPHAQEYRVPVVSWLTGLLSPLGLFALGPIWLFVLVRAWLQRRGPVGVVLAFLLAVSLTQFGTAALGDGIEGVKHQSVALFTLLLALVLAALPQSRSREPRWGRNSSVGGPSSAGETGRGDGFGQNGGTSSSTNTSSPASPTRKIVDDDASL